MGDASIELAPVRPWDEGAPQLTGPRAYGVRPGSPAFHPVSALGERPLAFAVEGLPPGLAIDATTGIISGRVDREGGWRALVRVRNAHGSDERELAIAAGERVCLTPPLGWNSWNVWAATVDEAKVRESARCMVRSGLAAHGFSYLNIDDGWQGDRAGPPGALQPNGKFPDLAGLCGSCHAMGLRLGVYSTPWVRSFAGYPGNSTGRFARYTGPAGHEKDWVRDGRYFGEVPHQPADAREMAAWGVDYLKYDWFPWEVADVEAMARALRSSGRDIVYSLSCTGPFERAADWSRLGNLWRTGGDITDTWESVSSIGFGQDRWAPYSGPGHWNDPDMLVVGNLGWGTVRANRLTPDEQVTHITLWALLAAPLLLGCDLGQLDDLTLRLVTNDELLAVDQDPLGRQARCVGEERREPADGRPAVHRAVYARPLADGSTAVGLFNRGERTDEVAVGWKSLGVAGPRRVRDLWAREELGIFEERLGLRVPPHGARLLALRD